jgi:hypothetical protein
MALAAKALPYGLRDIQLRAISAAGVVSTTSVDLPVARTLSFSDTEDFEELRGDDRVEATHGNGATCEWELEAGGISLEAYALLAGGLVTSSGTTPAIKKTYNKKVTNARPYVQIEGQAISDNGGDLHGLIYRAKADGSLEGEMGDGAFWLTSASGKGYADSSDNVYDFIHNETALPIVTGP